MSIVYTTLRKNLYELFSPFLAVLIWANPNADRPKTTYWDMMLSPLNKIGGNDYQGSPDSVTEMAQFLGNREFTLQFRSFRTGGIQGLIDLLDKMEIPETVDLFNEKGLVFVEFLSGVQDITDIVRTRYEERGVLDMRMRTASDFAVKTGIIENLEADFNIKEFYDTVYSGQISITT